MGALGSLNYFSLDKFIQDCERERETRRIWLKTRHDFVVPLYLPQDKGVVSGIREIAEKGGAKNADHTLNNVGAFIDWRRRLIETGEKKVYFPELRNSLQNGKDELLRVPQAACTTQLKDTLFPA
jgi:trimethylamine--corrinoid protein Co-methyltransferase